MPTSAAAPAALRRPEEPYESLLDTTMGEQADPADEPGEAEQAGALGARPAGGAAVATQGAEDEFVFDAPAYFDLRNPSLFERQYVNNADGYFSSPAPSAATSRPTPPTADVPAKSADGQLGQQEEEGVTRSLSGAFAAVPVGKENAPADEPVRPAAPSAFSQNVPRLGSYTASVFPQAVPSLGSAFAQSVPSFRGREAAAKAPAFSPIAEKADPVDVGNNAAEDAEMTDDAANKYAASLNWGPVDTKAPAGASLDNQARHELDTDAPMSDAESERTVEMDTSAVLADAAARSGSTADAVASAIEEEDEETAAAILSRSLLSENGSETFEEVLEKYAASSQSSATSHRMQDVEPPSHSSFHSSQGFVSPRLRAGRRSPPPSLSESSGMSWASTHSAAGVPPPPSSAGSHSSHSSVSSRLLQPTESFLLRMHTEQRMREQSYLEDVRVEEKPHRVTKPRSPKLRTSQKAEARPRDPNDVSRMSSTSRELLKIQEERLRLQMERMKIREFHEKSKVHRPPANVFQRSTKQLTIPESPHLSVDSRARRFHGDGNSDSGSDADKPSMITPEALLSREFVFPAAKSHQSHRSGLPHPTVPHTPQLQTASRASRRGIVPDASKPAEPERPRRAGSAPTSRTGGVTQPATPQLETRRRAQTAATYRRPVEANKEDELELAKKFHARPVNKKMLEMKLERPPSKPSSPKLSAGSRAAARSGASSEAKRQGESARQGPAQPRRPVIPDTPPLKSIQLHRQYQEQFRRRIEEEQRELERQREFKANPMRVSSTPPRFGGSNRPLTELQPFAMPGEKHHELARERLEAKRQEVEQRLKALTKFHANPMPVFSGDAVTDGKRAPQPKPSAKPLTSFAAPVLASDRRAAERAAFDAAERERREIEEAYRRRMEEEARRAEEEEIKRLRKEEMVFHARPVPEPRAFALKSNTKPLTQPMTPVTHFRSRDGGKQ